MMVYIMLYTILKCPFVCGLPSILVTESSTGTWPNFWDRIENNAIFRKPAPLYTAAVKMNWLNFLESNLAMQIKYF